MWGWQMNQLLLQSHSKSSAPENRGKIGNGTLTGKRRESDVKVDGQHGFVDSNVNIHLSNTREDGDKQGMGAREPEG